MSRSPFRFLWFLLVGLCVIMAAGCGGSRDATEQAGIHVQRGMDAYSRADYARALSSFQKALQFTPDDARLYLYIAELYDDYLGDKLRAVNAYREFLKRSTDEELNAWVERWITEAEEDAVKEQPTPDLVVPEDPNTEVRELRTKLVQERILKEQYAERVRELEAIQRTANKSHLPLSLPILLVLFLGFGAAAAFLAMRLARRHAPIRLAPEGSTLDEELVIGRYFWVENEFNLGTISIEHEDGQLRVDSTSLSTNAHSVGRGRLEKDTLRTELADESGLKAPTVFRFAPDGMSFTAEWTDDLGPGVAIGVRER